MVYDDRHRTFLQAIMQGGAVREDEAISLCNKIFNERISLATVIDLINDKLLPIEMTLKAGMCELTGDKFWSVVGTTHEEALMLPSEFTNAQRAYLRTIYSEIINSDAGHISSTDCLNLVSTLDTKLSMSDGDKFIRNVVRRKWLHIVDGFVYIGVRSIIELMPYFRATHIDNFHNCSLCKEIIFFGQKCAYCEHLYHNYCLVKYKSIQKEDICPECKHLWTAAGDDIPDEITQSIREKGKRKEANNDEAMEVSEEVEISQSIDVSQKAKKRKRNHK